MRGSAKRNAIRLLVFAISAISLHPAVATQSQSTSTMILDRNEHLCSDLLKFYSTRRFKPAPARGTWPNPAFEDLESNQTQLSTLGLVTPNSSDNLSYTFERQELKSLLYKSDRFTAKGHSLKLFLQDFPIGTAGSISTRLWLISNDANLDKDDNDRGQLDLLPPITKTDSIQLEVALGDYNGGNQPFRTIIGPYKNGEGMNVFYLWTGAILQRPFTYRGGVIYIARDEFPVRNVLVYVISGSLDINPLCEFSWVK